MSIASELTNLSANRDAIKAAIEAKNPATAPTTALSSFPAAIASIPTGGSGWTPPSEWPDIKAVLSTYPTGATSAESNVLVFLFDCTNITSIRMRCGTSYRFSDAPTTVETAAYRTTYVYHNIPSGTRYLWVAAYDAEYAFYGDVVNASGTSDGSNYSSMCIIWIAGNGVAEARGWGTLGACVAIDNGNSTFNTHGGGGGYLRNEYSLKSVTFKSVTISVTTLESFFNACFSLSEVDVSRWNTSSVTNLRLMFGSCSSLRTIDMSGWDTSSVTNFGAMFYYCSAASIDIRGWDMSAATNVSDMFNGTSALTSLVGGASSPSAPDSSKGPRLSLNLGACAALDRPSLLWLIAWLADLNTLGLSGQTLMLHAVAKTRLTASEMAVATAKGWTIA